jgi:DNA-directed RNA polymerase specialized sigma24 family protein
MDNYKETDYAKNKYSHNIVYETSKGTIEITVTQYLNENPTKEEADFWELKALSDEVYRQQAKEEHTQTNRNARFDENIESGFFCFPSPEEIFLAREERKREIRFIEELLCPLTALQRRRLILNIVEGLSHHEIARLEGVSQNAVSLCIAKAKRQIRSRFWR